MDFFVDSSQRNTGETKKWIIINILFDTVKDPTHEKETECDPKKLIETIRDDLTF